MGIDKIPQRGYITRREEDLRQNLRKCKQRAERKDKSQREKKCEIQKVEKIRERLERMKASMVAIILEESGHWAISCTEFHLVVRSLRGSI